MMEKWRVDSVLILPIHRLVLKLRGKADHERSCVCVATTSI
jgi:hypothetical protein